MNIIRNEQVFYVDDDDRMGYLFGVDVASISKKGFDPKIDRSRVGYFFDRVRSMTFVRDMRRSTGAHVD